MLAILLTVLGVVLITGTFFDVFVTVLHPQAESPISSRLQRIIWQGMLLAARALPGPARHPFLALGVPVLIVALVVLWGGVLLAAFGLIYAAWIGNAGAFHLPDTGRPATWLDALYFSGVTLGTVGYGDIQPLDPWIRFTAMVEGFSGITILSMGIAYVLEIYPIIQRQGVLAVLLNEEMAGQVNGLALLQRYLRNGNFEALADLLRLINLELLFLAEAHRRFPVLHNSHPRAVEHSFLRVVLAVQHLVAALRCGIAGGAGRAWSSDPRVQALEDSFFYTLYTLGTSLHLALEPVPAGQQRSDEFAAAFRALCARLDALHLPTPARLSATPGVVSEFDRASARFVRFHESSALALNNYLRNSGYTYAEATRDAVRPEILVRDLESDLPDQ